MMHELQFLLLHTIGGNLRPELCLHGNVDSCCPPIVDIRLLHMPNMQRANRAARI